MSSLAERLASLSPEQRRLLDRRLGQQAIHVPGLDVVPRRGARDSLPLSFAQQRLWFLDRMEPGGHWYNLALAQRLRGPLRVRGLARALGEIVRRHEVLRTVFRAAGEAPVQVVAPPGGFTLPVADLGALPAAEREREVPRRAREEARRPFDLERGPPFRATLLRVSPEDHVLLCTLHHIAGDGWSIGVLVRELSVLYAAFSRGEPSPLPEPEVQYADYALWQREHLAGEVLEARLAFWRAHLAGAPALLELPTDRPRPPVQSHRGATHPFSLPAAAAEGLRALSRDADATLYMTLLAGFQALLARYSGADDVVVGSPVAGRARPELEGLIGFFANTLALRADLADDPPFRELLARTRATTLEAYAHQDLPFERLVEELQPQRTLAYSPLFQVMLALRNAPAQGLALPGLALEPVAGVDTGGSKFDLTVFLRETPAGLAGSVEYAADLFDESTVARMMEHYGLLLEAVARDPAQRVSGLPLLGEEERRRVLVEWNDTAGTGPGDEGLHAPFERRAAARPGAVALEGEGVRLTYGELDARADRLARRLRAVGVGPEEVVAICAARSVEMVVAILAVLKAGGAYLPLDPSNPADRLAFMLRDTRPRALLAQARAAAALPASDVPVLLLDGADADPAPEHEIPLSHPQFPHSLAYVIYTSGSTGTPKGVMISHRAIRNRVRWVDETYPIGEPDAVLFKTPFTFDASIWELFLPLWSGARVVVAEPDAHGDPARLLDAMVRHRVTVLQLVPSMLQVLLAQPGLEACTSLRLLFCGGEALPVEVARGAAERLRTRVVNLYGPTEASIDVTSWPYGGGEAGPLVPIGRPITNTRIYLLDPAMRPVPVGVPGEVYAAGPGLARGYLGRPELTAERFVPDPFGAEPGARLYRVGDLARYGPDGAIVFLGRADHQVKLRGLRIELGEVESVLCRHPAVDAAVVVVRRGRPGDESLAAYLVPAAGEAWTAAGLREHLRRHLPEYMVPAAFVALDDFPRTTSGKVDRKRLPDPDEGAEGGGAGVPPRSPDEELLHEIWAEVLRRRPIGVHDGFFDLGGHSLAALRLAARVEAVFGVRLPVRALFDAPTIAGLAAALERLRADGAAPPAPPLAAGPREGDHPLSFAQQRLWILHQLEADAAAYNLSTLVPLPAEADVEAVEEALAEVARRHDVLRTVFPAGDGTGVQRVRPPAPVRVAAADFTGRPAGEEEARRHVLAEVLRPFDLARGPLLRATLVRADGVPPALLVVMHHIVCDGWSVGVLREELAALLEARRRGAAARLPELPVQYADFARWERSWLQGEVLEEQLAYWRERLAGAPGVIALPLDRQRPPVQSYRGASRTLHLPAELTGALRELARRSSATPYMVLLAAFKVLLHRYGAGDDVVVGTHPAGRSRVEVERLIGFFMNAVVLRSDLAGDPSFAAVVERVRETALGAFAHQYLPFERVVEELRPERDLSITPLYQVSFDLQQVGAAAEEGGARSFASERPMVKFDLDVTVADRRDDVVVALGYAVDLFDGATIERMLRHWEALLRGVAAEPGRPVADLPLLSDEETGQLLHRFQGERREYPTGLTLAEHFERRAAATPERTAVVAGADEVGYAELNRRANRLARLLREVGVRRGGLVGILEERGIDFVTGVLAVLKAGAAYVPLDPAYPEGRLRHMLSDSGASVLLTRSATAAAAAGALAGSPGLREVVCFDDPPGAILPVGAGPLPRVHPRRAAEALPAEDLRGVRGHPGDPAYVLYTSGSTGLPKGAVVRGEGAANHIFAELEVLRLGPELRFLQSAPSSSDISVWQMLAPLVAGGRTVVVDADTVSDPERLLRVLREEEITIAELVPAVLRNLLDHVAALPDERRSLPALRWIMATGEEVPVDLVNAWLRSYPAVPVVNAYGPTEASDDVTQLAMDRPLPASARSVSIGRPLPNLECHVLDAELRLVPVGVPGELCIGGIAVGNGYLGNPRRTSASFVPNPFARTPGQPMYRTGDRVRWLEDGRLEFLGRMDAQVKVRGFRIEPGEVEAALREDPGVRDCAVVVQEQGAHRRLAAYVVPAAGGAPDPERVRARLRRTLPEHMVPSAVVSLEALPLTPAGKVDRKALAADRRAETEAGEARVPPRTPTERRVAAIWGEVLGLPEVSADADFFRLGGHSLLAAMVVSRVRGALEVDLPLRRIFEHSTVAGLAAHLDGLLESGPRSEAPALARVQRSARRVRHLADGTLEAL